MDKRIGVIGVFIKDRMKSSQKVNTILSENGQLIIGRLGLPCPEREVSVISLIVEATTDEVGAFTGKLGMIDGVRVKSFLV